MSAIRLARGLLKTKGSKILIGWSYDLSWFKRGLVASFAL